MSARIYSPAKTATQSGKGKTGVWLLEHDAIAARGVEPLMGYTSSSDMMSQVRLTFDSSDEAVAYATKHGIAYILEQLHEPKRRRVSYSDNFKFDRKQPWTH